LAKTTRHQDKRSDFSEERTHLDLDAVILMATALSSKRRPAQLLEIVAAADLIQGFVPFPDKLGMAIERLSRLGLVCTAEDGFALTDIAQDIMARQPKKASQEDLVAAVKSSLGGLRPRTGIPPIQLELELLGAAVRAHKAARKAPGKNMLMPKPTVTRHFKVEGRWRRVAKTK
jgi:hypothetical protein